MTNSAQHYEEPDPIEDGSTYPPPELYPARLDGSGSPEAWDLARDAASVLPPAPPGRVWIEVPAEDTGPRRRQWPARCAAVVGLCLLWASGLGAATVWPRWNRVQMLRVQIADQRARVAVLESRVGTAMRATGSSAAGRARDRVLSEDQVTAFLCEVRSQASRLGVKVIALDHSRIAPAAGRIEPASVRAQVVAEGSFPALYGLLRYLERRRVFVAVSRAELSPITADGRLKASYQCEFLVVPAASADGTAKVQP